MIGEINENGALYIERHGKLIEQICPFAQDECHCGHWCPLFGEPFDTDADNYDQKPVGVGWCLLVCKKTLHFETLIDKR